MEKYVVAGQKPWNRRVFDDIIKNYPGEWFFIADRSDLTLSSLQKLQPRYVFFLHWSYKIPEEILTEFECVCFHMTDVPYGRGGSPLQNLIVRGHRETQLTALKMVLDFDAGPVYAKHPMSLEGSTAEEIFIRSSYISAKIIGKMVESDLSPVDQVGKPVIFMRRKPEQSEIIDDLISLNDLHDFIRMLDAEGYPKAFIKSGNYRLEFSRSALYEGYIHADVKIYRSIEE